MGTKTRLGYKGRAYAILAGLDVQTAGEPALPKTPRLPAMPPPPPRRTLQDDSVRQERIRQVETQLLADAGDDREGMVALDNYGAIVFTKLGGRDEIVFTRDEIEMMAGRDVRWRLGVPVSSLRRQTSPPDPLSLQERGNANRQDGGPSPSPA